MISYLPGFKTCFCFLSLVFGLALHTHAQRNDLKWGKIPEEDLAMKKYDPDPTATGLVLDDYGHMYFEFAGGRKPMVILERHKRVKILEKEGFEEGDVRIPFHKKSQKLKSLKAQVILSNGDKVELSKKDYFEADLSDSWASINFALPNLDKGVVLEYKYTLESDDYFALEDWYFQSTIPTRYSQLVFEMPRPFEYVKLFSGYGALSVDICTGGMLNTNGYNGASEKCTFVAENLEGLELEPYMTTLDDNLFKVKFQLRSINIPGETYNEVLSNWARVAKELDDLESFGQQYKRKGNFKNLREAAAPILVKAKTASEKALFASEFLSKNVKQKENYRSIFVRESLASAFEQKIATAGERNLMLLALLHDQDISAYPVLISSRMNGKPILAYPIVSQFDHLIILVDADGKKMFLDVQDEFCPSNLISSNCLNSFGLLLNGDASQWVDIRSEEAEDVYIGEFELDPAGQLQGTLTGRFKNYSAVHETNLWRENPNGDFWKERLSKAHSDVELQSSKIVENNSIYEPFKTEVVLNIPEGAQVSNDLMYLSPIFFSQFLENPFKKEKRSFPVDLPYPLKEQIINSFAIPPGYAAESLPVTTNLVLPNNGGKFQFLSSQKDGKIQIMSKIYLNQTIFNPDEYAGLKNFFDLIQEKLNEQVVLKKA